MTSSEEPVNARLKSLIYSGGEQLPHRYDRAISFMLEHHPGLEETINRLVQMDGTSSERSGVNSVLAQMRRSLLRLSDQMALSDDPDELMFSYTENYNDVSFNEVLVRAWSIGSVRYDLRDITNAIQDEVAPFGGDDEDIQESFFGYTKLIYKIDGADLPDRRDDVAFWRGFAAFNFVYVRILLDVEDIIQNYEARQFISWAGSQEHLASIVRASIARDTLYPKDLQEIAAQIRIAPSLGEGAL